ncbi:MAG: HD domain-containing protein [Anaerolineae bacterium]|nr:HD domain-containing protein [Anaerolineae bacterium]
MSRLTVADLRLNTQLDKAPFLLASMNQATDRNGDSYLKLTLRDNTGDIPALYWRVPSSVVEQLAAGSGAAVSGRVTEYRGKKQISLTGIFPCTLSNPEDFVPMARRPQQEMFDELQRLISSIKNPYLRQLLKAVLADADFQKRFLLATAAKTYHHACIGGLLEHSLDVVRQVVLIAQRYPEIDRDLAATVALLHDIGKVDSYSSRGDFEMTDEGKLLGHIYMGTARVERAMDNIENFPQELRLRVLHALLAHHGEKQKGSPVIPCTPEAIVLHYADNLDGDLRGWFDYVSSEGSPETGWTSRSNMHDTALFVGYQDEPQNEGEA